MYASVEEDLHDYGSEVFVAEVPCLGNQEAVDGFFHGGLDTVL